MTDPLDRLRDALRRETPPPSETARQAALRAAAENFSKELQGSAAQARPTSDRPHRAAGFWNGVKPMLSHITLPRALMGTTAIATIALAVIVTRDVPLPTGPAVGPVSLEAPKPLEEREAQIVGGEDGNIGGYRGPVGNADMEEGDADMVGAIEAEPMIATDEIAAAPQNRLRSNLEDARRDAPAPMQEAPAVAMKEAAPMGQAAVGGRLERQAEESVARSVIAPAPVPEPPAGTVVESNTEQYPDATPNSLKVTKAEPVSTFSIDVDTAAYGVVRSSLTQGVMPPREAVRIEEMINYFGYAYPMPESAEVPFRTSVSVAPTPWNPDTQLLHIGIQGYDLAPEERPPLNLVFLIDTSGSMDEPNKLPLLIRSFKLLLETLREDDSVAIVTYAGSAGMALEPTPASERAKILASLDRLRAGGSTAGQAGLQQAYGIAQLMTEEGEVTRVILATDGDFNVGISDPERLKEFVAERRDSGTYLSVLGFGRGNYNDAIMQSLAQNGNGTAAYIDTLAEAQKVLVEDVAGALFPIANDVKIQIEFNPAQISEYRLIGYETRALAREDFNNDAVDAGEIGAGHRVTALYEITPVGSPAERITGLRYGEEAVGASEPSAEYAFLKLRYKRPGEDRSNLIETPVMPDRRDIAPGETDFAAAVAGFGMLLRGGTEITGWDFDDALALASGARGDDPFGYRAELLSLIRLARTVQ